MAVSDTDQSVARTGDDHPWPDPHGQAAMLLVESLLHGLIERSVISVADAIRFVEAAADVREEVGYDRAEPSQRLAKSLTMLRSVASSLRFDLPDTPASLVE